LLQPDLLELLKLIPPPIEVETNGTIFKPEILNYATVNVSPKIQFMNPDYKESLRKWATQATFKYVIEKGYVDLDAYKKLSREVGAKKIVLMPEGVDPKKMLIDSKELTEKVKTYWPAAQVIPRMHIIYYGNERAK